MVSNCANPQCAKPLHYLREGRVFVFDVQDQFDNRAGEKHGHHLEHYWLCGACAQLFHVQRERENGIRLVPRQSVQREFVRESVEESSVRAIMAS